MKQGEPKTKRPVVVILCAVIRVGRRVRETYGPYMRDAKRWVVHRATHTAVGIVEVHIIVAAVSTAALALAAAWAGGGTSQLCKVAGAVVVGAVAVSAARAVIRRRQLGQRPGELRPVLASAAHTVLGSHSRLPAARLLRVLLGPQRSAASASVGIALAVWAPSLADPTLVRLALKPALRLVPAVGAALDAHHAYRDCVESARFVRTFAEAAASLCPEPELPALCA